MAKSNARPYGIVLALLLMCTQAWATSTFLHITDFSETSTSGTEVESMELGSGDGLTSSDWLILYSTGGIVDSHGSDSVVVQFKKNDTLITDERFQQDPEQSTTWMAEPFDWFYMCESCSSSDTFQTTIDSASGNTTIGRYASMTAIDLGDLTKNTGWYIGDTENGAAKLDTAVSWTWYTGSSVTIDDNVEGETWLVFCRAQIDANASNSMGAVRVQWDDVGASSPTTVGACNYEATHRSEASTDVMAIMCPTVHTVPAGMSGDLKYNCDYWAGNTAADAQNMNVIAINLDELTTEHDSASSGTDHESTSGSTYIDYTHLAWDWTPSTTGTYLVLGAAIISNFQQNTIGSIGRWSIDTTGFGLRAYDGTETSENDKRSQFGMTTYDFTASTEYDLDLEFRNWDGGTNDAKVFGAQMIVIYEDNPSVGGVTFVPRIEIF